jgi:uncharacterized protein (DUF1697 family)
LKERFIAFLRGVNVAGRTLKKDVMVDAFVRAGLNNVRTHIASGNVSFDAPVHVNRFTLTRRLEKLLAEAAGYDVPVFLRSLGEVAAVLELDPFKKARVTPNMRLCIIFISEPLPKGTVLPFQSPKGDFDLLQASPGEVFAIMYVRDGRPGNPSAYIEKTHGVKATTRFFGATAKILAAAKEPMTDRGATSGR